MDSYVRGQEADLLDLTIHELFTRTVRQQPDREALVACHQRIRYTWSQLAAEVERVARGLVGLGLNPGDRIGIWAPNCAEWVLLQLAAARAAVVLVNINPAYRAHELAYALHHSRVRVLFLRESDDRSCYRDILAQAAEDAQSSVSTIYLGTADWDRMLENGAPVPAFISHADDVANLQYTSGTTGSPKGVLLSHKNLVNNGRFIAELLHASERDRICVPVPLYHCFGCVIGTMVWINSGSAMVLPDQRFMLCRRCRRFKMNAARSSMACRRCSSGS